MMLAARCSVPIIEASDAPFLKRLRYMATISWTRRIYSTFSAFVYSIASVLLFLLVDDACCFLGLALDGRLDAKCDELAA